MQEVAVSLPWMAVLLAGNFIVVVVFGAACWFAIKEVAADQEEIKMSLIAMQPKKRKRKVSASKKSATKAKKSTPKNPLAAAVEQSG